MVVRPFKRRGGGDTRDVGGDKPYPTIQQPQAPLSSTPTPQLPVPTAAMAAATHTQPAQPARLTRDKLEAAKRLLEDAGIDPSILEKLVDRIKDIDSEIEELENEIRERRRRIAELERQKQLAYNILSKFLGE